jgi:hypothetical protein
MRLAATVLSLFLAAACTTTNVAPASQAAQGDAMVSPILTTPEARDTSTYAQPEVARVTHVALDLALDFAAKQVGGTATLDILAQPDADEIVLDSDGLQITRITDEAGNELPFRIGETDEEKGAPLTIEIGDARRMTIAYQANPQADALQWLSPEQTAGGEHPYLLSQGQAILNRSWIPTQDSPGIRQTWEARITAPKPLDVVMSGIRQGEPEDLGDRRAFRFEMDNPVPPYLIAIAAGDIDFRALGPRTGVWSEPEVLDRAAAELTAAGLPLRRHGEPGDDLPHADLHRRRPQPHRPRRPRAGALLVGQPGDQLQLARFLAQRRRHLLLRRPHHRGNLRRGTRRAGRGAKLRLDRGRSRRSGRGRPRHRAPPA